MAQVEAARGSAPERGLLGRLWFNRESRSVIMQVAILALLVGFVAFIWSNAYSNLQRLGVSTGFDFLFQTSFYDLPESLIEYDSESTHGRAYLVGLLNTLQVAIFGCILATLIGFIGGIARLSHNWLINRFAYVFVEFTRNVPILLHILLWYGLIIWSFPRVKQSFDLGADIYLNNRGLVAPSPILEPGSGLFGGIILAAIIGLIVFARWAKRRQTETGQHLPVFRISLAALILVPVIAYFATGQPISWDSPELRGFNFRGGMSLSPEFVALTWALALYTGAFIAEIVRAGIQSVSHGQTEAAYAVGLRPNWTMRLVIIPQALRVIVPPLTSQYLNLTKNSSLAIAIGYVEVTGTIGGITLNQTGQAIECVAIMMATYLAFSLIISAFMNWYNRRIALVER